MINLSKLSDDQALRPYQGEIDARKNRLQDAETRLTQSNQSLVEFASAHEFYGLHKCDDGWIFREWAPNATEIFISGDFCDWGLKEEFRLKRTSDAGDWEIKLPLGSLAHGDYYHLFLKWNGGEGSRIPAYARRVVQDDKTKLFCAQVWDAKPYIWKNSVPPKVETPLIYESHVGMAQEKHGVGTYEEFREEILPRVIASGYNTLQLMAVMEHPYYGSFGYHVSSFFSASSRFGTPEDLKQLIDEAHGAGLNVIIDLVHSHSVKNDLEGLARFDGTTYQYFHEGERGSHEAWDSRCFNYGKTEVMHFLLSNCRYWIDEYNIDGFRFDGVTSMLYHDHGLGRDFTHYDTYFYDGVDHDALTYLGLANKLIHEIRPNAMTIAEDVSGMPGIGVSTEEGGLGFDFKLAMGTPDFWYNILESSDEQWNVEQMWYELTNRRRDEKSITYVESHDQSIVGSKTIAFELMDAAMYSSMGKGCENGVVERGIALHKMIRLITLVTGGHGYLTFIGNEFGHPEWVDFPREGNDWSYEYSRRKWSLADDQSLRYHYLNDFDKKIIHLFNDENLLVSDPEKLFVHCDDHLLVAKRGDYLFIFNFSPTKSYADYPIDVPAGSYELSFGSDDSEFGGYNRIEAGQHYATMDENGRTMIKVYTPSRTVLVLKKTK